MGPDEKKNYFPGKIKELYGKHIAKGNIDDFKVLVDEIKN